MAIYKNLCSWVLKGVKSCNGCIVRFWGINFNLPFPDLWAGGCAWDYNAGYMCTRYGSIGGSSQDLTGFYPGYEVATSDVLYRFCVTDGSCLNGISKMWIRWLRSGACFVNSYTLGCVNIQAPNPGWTWTMYESMYMTGIDYDEVCCSAMYGTEVSAECYSGDNLSIGGCSIGVCFCNVPSTAQCDYAMRGYIWVEGNNLNFINSRQWKHSICGDCQSNVGSANAGKIWIDNTHYLHWVGSTGNDYKAKWRICQFCSNWSNSSPANPSPGAGYAGALWVDSEFGNTHLSYIGCDGHKYLVGSGAYPYTAP